MCLKVSANVGQPDRVVTESAPLGRFSHKVSMYVCLSVCLSGCLRDRAQFLQLHDWLKSYKIFATIFFINLKLKT